MPERLDWQITASHLLIRDLCLEVCIGVSKAERSRLQRLLVSIEVEAVPQRAKEDDVASIVDYGKVVAAVRQLAQRETQLLETWVEWIAEICLRDDRILSATITLLKPDVYSDGVQVGVRQSVTRPKQNEV